MAACGGGGGNGLPVVHSDVTETMVSDVVEETSDTTAPTSPSQLKAEANSPTSVILTWVGSLDNVGVTGYKVFDKDSEIGTVTVPTFSHDGLVAGVEHCYHVQAFDLAGNVSGASNEACITLTVSVTYKTISAAVSGLVGSGLVLQNNLTDDLAISENGTYTFTQPIASGSDYSVSVLTQPSNPTQTCLVTSSMGTVVQDNVTVTVICTTNTFNLSVTVSGLASGNSITFSNGSDNLTITDTNLSTFAVKVASGDEYSVSFTNPTTPVSQTCAPTTPMTGTVGNADVSLEVICTTNTFALNVTVSGLASGNSIVFHNGSDDLTITDANQHAFATKVASKEGYSISFTNPTTPIAQTCTPTSPIGGTIEDMDVSIVVTCTINTYTVSAIVSGLQGSGLVLQNNLTDSLSISGDGTFTFTQPIASGQDYDVTVLTQPSDPSQDCYVTSTSEKVEDQNVSVSVKCRKICPHVSYVNSGAGSGSPVDSVSFDLNNTASTKGLMLIGIHKGTSSSVKEVVYDGVAATYLTETGVDGSTKLYLYYLVSPHQGNHALNVALDMTDNVIMTAAIYDNAAGVGTSVTDTIQWAGTQSVQTTPQHTKDAIVAFGGVRAASNTITWASPATDRLSQTLSFDRVLGIADVLDTSGDTAYTLSYTNSYANSEILSIAAVNVLSYCAGVGDLAVNVGKNTLYKLRATDGTIIWGPVARTNDGGLAVDQGDLGVYTAEGNHVYGGSSTIFKYDATGASVWSSSFTQANMNMCGAYYGCNGGLAVDTTSSNPGVVCTETHCAGYIVKFSRSDGAKLWGASTWDISGPAIDPATGAIFAVDDLGYELMYSIASDGSNLNNVAWTADNGPSAEINPGDGRLFYAQKKILYQMNKDSLGSVNWSIDLSSYLVGDIGAIGVQPYIGGAVYVADNGAPSIVVVHAGTSDGAYLRNIDTTYTPVAIAVDPVSGNVYVGSSESNSIRALTIEGYPVWTSPDLGVPPNRLAAARVNLY